MKYKVILDRGVDITRKDVVVVKGEAPRTVTAHYEHGEVIEQVPQPDADNMVKWGHLEEMKPAEDGSNAPTDTEKE